MNDDQEGKKYAKREVDENQKNDVSLEASSFKTNQDETRCRIGEVAPRFSSCDGNDDEERQLRMASSEGAGEAKARPRRQDMEAAAKLVLALDCGDTLSTNEIHATSHKVESEDKGPQTVPVQGLEVDTASPVMGWFTFLSKKLLKKDDKESNSIHGNKGTLVDVDTIPSGREATRDDNEDRVAAASSSQQHSVPRESRRCEVHQPGAFYEDGRNAREVVLNDESSCSRSDAMTQLVSAEVVDPEELQRMVQRELAEQQRSAAVAEVVTTFWCSRRVKIASAVGAVLVILAVVLGTVLPRVLEPPEPSSPLPGLIELLSEKSSDGGTALRNASTPQNKALNWLAGHADLDGYTDEEKIQRYVLATLYYSTSGENWKYNRAWMSDSNECLWYSNYDSFCSNGTVTGLGLYHNNLNGTIPVELAILSNTLGKNFMVPS